jgi:hypothetical protein
VVVNRLTTNDAPRDDMGTAPEPGDAATAHRRGWTVWVVLSLVALVLVVTAGSLGVVRVTYGVWTPNEAPTRFEICHQVYTRFDDHPRSLAEVTRLNAEGPLALVIEPTVGLLPIGVSEPDRLEEGAGYQGCGHLVLIRSGPDAYVMYFKLGGP